MLRRQFLWTLAGSASALVLGDAALEAYERLTHTRRSFPSGALSPAVAGAKWDRQFYYLDIDLNGTTYRLPGYTVGWL